MLVIERSCNLSYKKIAATCFISADTVSGHIENIYKKLQVHSKSEAVVKAIKGKIVQSNSAHSPG
jgi:DNA-binding CsgD family transcriptional regulator